MHAVYARHGIWVKKNVASWRQRQGWCLTKSCSSACVMYVSDVFTEPTDIRVMHRVMALSDDCSSCGSMSPMHATFERVAASVMGEMYVALRDFRVARSTFAISLETAISTGRSPGLSAANAEASELSLLRADIALILRRLGSPRPTRAQRASARNKREK